MEYKSTSECPCQLICAFPKDWKGAKSLSEWKGKEEKIGANNFLGHYCHETVTTVYIDVR